MKKRRIIDAVECLLNGNDNTFTRCNWLTVYWLWWSWHSPNLWVNAFSSSSLWEHDNKFTLKINKIEIYMRINININVFLICSSVFWFTLTEYKFLTAFNLFRVCILLTVIFWAVNRKFSKLNYNWFLFNGISIKNLTTIESNCQDHQDFFFLWL